MDNLYLPITCQQDYTSLIVLLTCDHIIQDAFKKKQKNKTQQQKQKQQV